MKKYIVLSVNENQKYLYFLPLTVWAWRQFGWSPIVFYQGNEESKLLKEAFNVSNQTIHLLDSVDGFKSETIAQVSRLYAACVNFDGMLMTGDIDMIPLSDYWHPKDGEVTCYGRDLTDYHQPICYIAMPAVSWGHMMETFGNTNYNEFIKRDLRHQSNMWGLDQDIITERLLRRGNITHIDRGTDPRTGYPIGRVDRSHWTLNHEVFIDAHLPHDCLHNPQNYNKVMELLRKVWPNEDFTWFDNYTNEFKNLL